MTPERRLAARAGNCVLNSPAAQKVRQHAKLTQVRWQQLAADRVVLAAGIEAWIICGDGDPAGEDEARRAAGSD